MPTKPAAAKASTAKPKVNQRGSKKPSGSSQNKAARKSSTTRKSTPKVTELVFEANVARMPSGNGGIRYAEQEADGREFLVFGQPYMTQDAFKALGLKEGDSIKVTVEKA